MRSEKRKHAYFSHNTVQLEKSNEMSYKVNKMIELGNITGLIKYNRIKLTEFNFQKI